jgi:hypothetical protein
MFCQNQVTFGAAMWVCLCLVAVSLFAGALLGDRYKPFSNETIENRLRYLEERNQTQDEDIRHLKEAPEDGGKKK